MQEQIETLRAESQTEDDAEFAAICTVALSEANVYVTQDGVRMSQADCRAAAVTHLVALGRCVPRGVY